MLLISGATSLYYLVSEINEELGRFILTGEPEANEYHVFSEEKELAMIRGFSKQGKIINHRNQQIIYMHRCVTITYLEVSDLKTGMKVSFIPWFLIPGRPYPVFAYIYAIWHYHNTDKKSLKQTAAATEKLFGIDGFNKSTVIRNIKAMEDFIKISQINKALSAGEHEPPSDEDMAKCVTEILTGCPSIETLEAAYGERVKQLPKPIGQTATVKEVLSEIPDSIPKIIKEKAADGKGPKDLRNRPARRRIGDPKRGKRLPQYDNSVQFISTRKKIISICKQLVLDAAIIYHRFLI